MAAKHYRRAAAYVITAGDGSGDIAIVSDEAFVEGRTVRQGPYS
jgi:hypothetical protein